VSSYCPDKSLEEDQARVQDSAQDDQVQDREHGSNGSGRSEGRGSRKSIAVKAKVSSAAHVGDKKQSIEYIDDEDTLSPDVLPSDDLTASHAQPPLDKHAFNSSMENSQNPDADDENMPGTEQESKRRSKLVEKVGLFAVGKGKAKKEKGTRKKAGRVTRQTPRGTPSNKTAFGEGDMNVAAERSVHGECSQTQDVASAIGSHKTQEQNATVRISFIL